MSSKKSLCFLLLLMFITNPANCKMKEVNDTTVGQCGESPSCGHIHNISYPFRLKGQHKDCGEPKYELDCENNSTLTVDISSVKYFVRSINPNNFRIRVVESVVQSDNCSIPLHQITAADHTPATWYHMEYTKGVRRQKFYREKAWNHEFIFVSCEKPLTNRSAFVDTRPCINGSRYSYVTSLEHMKMSDIGELCSVDSMALSAKPSECGLNCSYSEIHDLISYGFELSWRVISCQKYCKGYGFCYLENHGNVIAYCGDDRCGFRCLISRIPITTLLGFLYLIILGIVILLALRFVIGLPIFCGFLILLDEKFCPKVSDFGLAKLYPLDGTIKTLTAIRGTIGYIAPELLYRNIGNVSHKSDVYSFGMLLLEMTGKRRRLDSNGENSSQITYFPDWIYDQMSKGKSLEMEDVIKEHETKLVNKMVIVGLWCIQTSPNDRPSMDRVIEMLESDIKCLEMPPKHSLQVEEEIYPFSSSVLSGDSTESSTFDS